MSPLTAPCRYLQIDRKVLTHALMLALSAWVAFAIAAIQHVQNAYWAAMPIWVVAQASRGMLLERGFFRVVGTLLGAGAGFAFLHVPVHPYGQLALLGLWVAANAGLTHLLRGVHGYAAMLAGMTAAIVVIPSLLSPAASLDLAFARVECTLIGVIVVTVITGLVTPDSPRQALYARVRLLSADAVAYAVGVLQSGVAGSEAEERRILGEISEVEASAPLVLAGSLEGYRRRHDIDSLVVGALSIMSAALVLRQSDSVADDDLVQHLRRVAKHLQTGDISRCSIGLGLLDQSGFEYLASALARILEANDALLAPGSAAREPIFHQRLSGLAPHREWSLAGRTAVFAGAATFVTAALGYWTGWTPVMLGAMGVCIFSMVLGSLALPQNIAPKLLIGVALGIAVAILYRFTVQPAVDSTAGLLLSLAPFLLLGGIARASPRTAIAGVDANMCFLLASQAGAGVAATASIVLSDGLALLAAAGLVAGSFILLPRRAARQAEDAAEVIRRDLLRMIESAPRSTVTEWRARTSRQILRLALHLGRAKALAERWPNGLLAVLNLGRAIEQLHDIPFSLSQQTSGGTKAEILGALKSMVRDPFGTARIMRRLAESSGEAPLRQVLLELAGSLEQSASLLTFATKEAARSSSEIRG